MADEADNKPEDETPSAQPEAVDTTEGTTDAAAAADAPAESPAAPPEPADTPVEDPVAAAMAQTEGVEAPAESAPAAETDGSEPAGDSLADDLTLGEGAPSDVDAGPKPAPVIRGKTDRFGVAMGTGRRKTAIARVRLKSGQGAFTVNGKPVDEFFCVERDQKMVYGPLDVTDTRGKLDVWVRVEGGGTTGQTGAVVLGIARALQAVDPNFHDDLQHNGYLTRDERMVERKKPGRKKARRGFQFSKR